MNKLDLFFNENMSSTLYNRGVDDISLFIQIYNNFETINFIIFSLFLAALFCIILSQLLNAIFNLNVKWLIYIGLLAFIVNIPIVLYATINSQKVYLELTYNPPTAITGVQGEPNKLEFFYPIEAEKLDDFSPIKYLFKEDYEDIKLYNEKDYCEVTLIGKDNHKDIIIKIQNRNVFEKCSNAD